MSITKSYDHSYYYLQQAKKLANYNDKEWDKLSKIDKDYYEKLARDKENDNKNITW
jgi:hypothetical protein